MFRFKNELEGVRTGHAIVFSPHDSSLARSSTSSTTLFSGWIFRFREGDDLARTLYFSLLGEYRTCSVLKQTEQKARDKQLTLQKCVMELPIDRE